MLYSVTTEVLQRVFSLFDAEKVQVIVVYNGSVVEALITFGLCCDVVRAREALYSHNIWDGSVKLTTVTAIMSPSLEPAPSLAMATTSATATSPSASTTVSAYFPSTRTSARTTKAVQANNNVLIIMCITTETDPNSNSLTINSTNTGHCHLRIRGLLHL